jgi:hypothetical protein
VAHVPPLEEHGQQMGVEQSTPLDSRSSPRPNSLASNCEKDVNLELEKRIIFHNSTWRIYLLNDEVVHSPQRSPLPSFAHVALVVMETSANNKTSILMMAPMNKLDAFNLATLVAH